MPFVCAELIPTSALLYAQNAFDSRKCSKNKCRSCLTTKFARATTKPSQERSSGFVRLKVMPCCLFVSITRHAAVALLSNVQVIKQRRRTAETKLALNFLVRAQQAPDAHFQAACIGIDFVSIRDLQPKVTSVFNQSSMCVLKQKQLLLNSHLNYLHDRHGVKMIFSNHLFAFCNSYFQSYVH